MIEITDANRSGHLHRSAVTHYFIHSDSLLLPRTML